MPEGYASTSDDPTRSAPRLCACGCGAEVARKFVRGHHMRLPGAHPPPSPVEDRIRASSRRNEETGCWLWTLRLDEDGYGSIKIEGRTKYAARVAYETFVGPIPDGHVVHARCGNHACVSPSHLEAITPREMVKRGGSDPLANFADYYDRRRNATHCPNDHPWDEDNTRYAELPNGGWQRVCRSCIRETMRHRRADPDLVAAERARSRELYVVNADQIKERKSLQSRTRYAELRTAGLCTARGCGEQAAPGRSRCSTHLAESAARNWGVRQYPMVDIYAERGLTTCWLCLAECTPDDPMWHDHLIPRSLGGPDEPWNLAPAHRSCNIRRRNTPLADTVALWHPSGLPDVLDSFMADALSRAAAM